MSSVILSSAVSVEWCLLYADCTASKLGDADACGTIRANTSLQHFADSVQVGDRAVISRITTIKSLFFFNSGVTCAVLNRAGNVACSNDRLASRAMT